MYVLIEFEEKHEVAPSLENKLIIHSRVVWWSEAEYVHNSTSWGEFSSLLDVRGSQLALFQNHMARGLKGLFRETLSAVNILFLIGNYHPTIFVLS